MPPRRAIAWETAIVAGGIVLIWLTYRTYELPLSFSAAGHARITASQADRRIEAAKSRLQSQPDDFNAWAQMGIAYFAKGPESYVDGLNAIEKARALGATSDELFYYAGLMYQQLHLPDYAANELAKYLRHHPGDYETQARLANAYFEEKRYDDALTLYKEALAHWSNDPTLWFNYAVVNKEKGQLDEAMAAFEKVRQLAHILPEGGLFQEGEIARLKGMDDQAIQLYQEELTGHPDYLPALEALEAAQRKSGKWKEARATRQRIAAVKNASHG